MSSSLLFEEGRVVPPVRPVALRNNLEKPLLPDLDCCADGSGGWIVIVVIPTADEDEGETELSPLAVNRVLPDAAATFRFMLLTRR